MIIKNSNTVLTVVNNEFINNSVLTINNFKQTCITPSEKLTLIIDNEQREINSMGVPKKSYFNQKIINPTNGQKYKYFPVKLIVNSGVYKFTFVPEINSAYTIKINNVTYSYTGPMNIPLIAEKDQETFDISINSSDYFCVNSYIVLSKL